MQRILVIDDDEDIHPLLIKALKSEFLVSSLTEIQDTFLDEIAEHAPDLILLDISMPRYSGFDICLAIKNSNLGHIPVVMLTAMNDKTSIDRSFNSLADDFITKPIDLNLLPFRLRFNLRHKEILNEISLKKKTIAKINQTSGVKYWTKQSKQLVNPSRISEDTLISFYFGSCVETIALMEKKKLLSHRASFISQLKMNDKQVMRFTIKDLDEERHFVETVYCFGNQVLGVVQDTTALVLAQDALHGLAYFDEKTGMPNENLFRKNLKLVLGSGRRESRRFAVITVCLRNLIETAESVGQGFYLFVANQTRDHLARHFGVLGSEVSLFPRDEFKFLKFYDSDEALKDLVGGAFPTPFRDFNYRGGSFRIEFKIGLSLFPTHGSDVDSLIAQSQFAASEKNEDIMFSLPQKHSTTKKVLIRSEINDALEFKQFVLHFQPQINIRSSKIYGAEALIRWNHPKRGFTYPGYFIQEIESNTQIKEVGAWVLWQACRQCRNWLDLGFEIRISVNLSPVQIDKELTFIHYLKSYLREHMVPASLIGIEITEGVFLEEQSLSRVFFDRLKETGVTISLDDFGTGFSSLKYLKDLPVDVIKIDRHFVKNIESDVTARAFVQCNTSLAESMNMKVIAEAVETEEVAMIMGQLGCDSIQGYCLPVDEKDFLLLLRKT